MEDHQNLAAPLRVWARSLAPDVLVRMAATPDDVDWLVWVPDHLRDRAEREVVGPMTVCDAHWSYYYESSAQEFLGPEHRGDGWLVTCTHA